MFAIRRTTLSAVRQCRWQSFPGMTSSTAVCQSRSKMSTLVLDPPSTALTGNTTSITWSLPEWMQDGLHWISTLKRRRKMMNKHKLRKRRKKNRMKTRK